MSFLFSPCRPCCRGTRVLVLYNWAPLATPSFSTDLSNYYAANGATVTFDDGTLWPTLDLNEYKLIFVFGVGETLFPTPASFARLTAWFGGGGRLVFRIVSQFAASIEASISYINGRLSTLGSSIFWEKVPAAIVFNGYLSCGAYTRTFADTYITDSSETFRFGDYTGGGPPPGAEVPTLQLSGGTALVGGNKNFAMQQAGSSEIYVPLPESAFGGFCALPSDNLPFLLRLWSEDLP